MKSVRIRAYAKVNLCLDILGPRADGYHELRTIFQTISLHDTLDLEPMPDARRRIKNTTQRAAEIELRVIGDSALAGEPGRDNLVYRALDALHRETRLASGIRATLTKRIPAGRGLGGGSSDAAAALTGLLRLTGKRVEPARLAEIASGLGADVPFFLHGGRALGVGRGNEIFPLPDIPRKTLLVVSPPDIAVPTPDAYRWLRRTLTKRPDLTRLMRFCALCWSTQGDTLSNDFEAAVFPHHPRLAQIKRELLRRGAVEAALAGSGSAVFGIYRNPVHARRAARTFPKDQVFVCSFISRAEYRRKSLGSDFV